MTGHPGHGGTQLGAPQPGRSWDPWERAWPHQGPCASGKERPGQKFPSQRLAQNPWDILACQEGSPWSSSGGGGTWFSPQRRLQKQCTRCTLEGTTWEGRGCRRRLGRLLDSEPPGPCQPLPAPCVLLFLPASSSPGPITQRVLKDPKPSSRRASHLMVGEGTAV